MSEAFERFSRGEDRLAALLRALPPFEPPAAAAGDFAQSARQAQAVADQRLPFTPPPSLEASFRAVARRIQADQAPRQAAVLAQLAAGRDAASVLGAPVTEATAAWLKAQPGAKASPAPAPAPAPWYWPTLRGLGFAASAMLVLVVAGQWLLYEEGLEPEGRSASLPASVAVPMSSAPVPAAAPPVTEGTAARARSAPPAAKRLAEVPAAESIVVAPETRTESVAPVAPATEAVALEQSQRRREEAPARPSAELAAPMAAQGPIPVVAAPAYLAPAPMAKAMPAPPPAKRVIVTSLAEKPGVLVPRLGALAPASRLVVRCAAPPPAEFERWLAELRQALPVGVAVTSEASASLAGETLEVDLVR